MATYRIAPVRPTDGFYVTAVNEASDFELPNSLPTKARVWPTSSSQSGSVRTSGESRIQGLTRQFNVAVCIDEATANFARAGFSPTQARVQRLARIRPKGMDTPVEISELLPPAAASETTDEQISAYESALEKVIAGNWSDAITELTQLTEEGPISFLLNQMSGFEHQPPADWDGAFSLTSK